MENFRRVVIKVGSAVITTGTGRINRRRVNELVREIAVASCAGMEVALVSSGAIASGMEKLGLKAKPREIPVLQAIAAVGQGLLIRMYTDLFGECGVKVGQVLLTQSDMSHRSRYLNARATIENLFKMGVVPVINENDTVATEEITFGDNDMLASLVAALVNADLLVLLTDIEGLYTADPRKDRSASLITRVERITGEIERCAGEIGSEFATGGMSSKIQAAKIAVRSGVPVVIASGKRKGVLERILAGEEVGTFFPASKPMRLRKHWIAYAKEPKGFVTIDDGAAEAILRKGKSLLPAGIISCGGDFEVGDCLEIRTKEGAVIAKGLSSYSVQELSSIMGLKSQQVRELLGERPEAVVHRDSLTILEEAHHGA